MESHIELRERFARLLEKQSRALEESEKSLRAEGRGDEAMLQKINRNVTGIFAKMLAACRKNIETGIALPAWKEATRGCESPMEQFSKGYPALCRGIMAPWLEKLEAARLHGDAIGAAIEENKIETAERLLRIFEAMAREGVRTHG